MQNREPFKVKWLAISWNGFLALFSIVALYSYGVLPLLPFVKENGLSFESCSVHSEFLSPWVFLFCLSKIPELFDTLIHVLKKQRIIFLHWYHHVTVMWFCWFAWAYAVENGGLFSTMNLAVHSVMYTYYTIAAFGVRFPNPIRLSITLLQIIQMVLGTAIIVHNIIHCNINPYIQYAGLFMYISYGTLFIQFFYNAYCAPKPKSESTSHNGKKHN